MPGSGKSCCKRRSAWRLVCVRQLGKALLQRCQLRGQAAQRDASWARQLQCCRKRARVAAGARMLGGMPLRRRQVGLSTECGGTGFRCC